MQEMDNKSKDIFEQAASIVLKKEIQTIEVKPEKKNNEIVPHEKTQNVKTWNQLTKAINTNHAQRFNQILEKLPDREFVRVYLKGLEFFKPKIIRQTGQKPNTGDNTINIQINYGKEENTIEDIKES
jgi:hypothetical protein